jgi:hypothetical protein
MIVPSRLSRRCAKNPGGIEDAAVAVSDRRVEVAVGAELEHPAVVVLPRLHDRQEDPLRVPVRLVRVGGVAAELGDADIAVSGARVVEGVEEPARRVVGRERDREETRLARQLHVLANVEERCRQHVAVANDAHGPRLLHDEEPLGVTSRRGHEHRPLEPADARERDDVGGVDGRRRGRRRRCGPRDAEGALHPEARVSRYGAEEAEGPGLRKRDGEDLALPRREDARSLPLHEDEVVGGVAAVAHVEAHGGSGGETAP